MRDAGPINSRHLLDDCYYVTAARLLGLTTDALIARIETMPIAGGIPTDVDYSLAFRLVNETVTWSSPDTSRA